MDSKVLEDEVGADNRDIVYVWRKYLGALAGVSASVSYGLTSIAITIFNKATLSMWKFDFPNTLCLFQSVFTLLFLLILSYFGLFKVPRMSRVVVKLRWVILCFIGMLFTGISGLIDVNIPVYNVLRRLTTLAVLLGTQYILHQSVPPAEQLCIYGMLSGALFTGYGDLKFDLVGYVLTLFNCVFTSGYLLAIGEVSSLRVTVFEQLWFTNLFSTPIFLALSVVMESVRIQTYKDWGRPSFLVCLLLGSMQGFFLNVFIFICSIVNTPLTTSVTGQIKNLVTTALGILIFNDFLMNTAGYIGIIISAIFSVIHVIVKYMQLSQNKKQYK